MAARRTLHGLAELVLAGPQHRRSGTIRLRVNPDGFTTVAEPPLELRTTELVAGDLRIPLAGHSYAHLAAAAGLVAGAPEGLYHDGSAVDLDEPIQLDPGVGAHILACLNRGDQALRRLDPVATPVLWPEHFDVAISMAEVNYGVSGGDGYCPEPYAYVGPWKPRPDPFFTAPFGAARPMAQLATVEDVLDFFARGRAAAGS